MRYQVTNPASSFNQSSPTSQIKANASAYADQANSSLYPVLMIVYTLVFLVGFILNGFIMRFYFCTAHQKPPSCITVYLKNLAAADFLLCLSLPLRISHYASRSPTVHLLYCNLGASIFYFNMYASILFMGFIAANRYLKIVHPLGTHFLQTVRAARIISMVTWIWLLTPLSVYVILSSHNQKPVINTVICEYLHSDQLTILYKVLHICSVATFMVVLISLIFFYHSTSRKLRLMQQSQPASASSVKLAKSLRNMLALVCVFCFCFVPYHTVRLPAVFLHKRKSWTNVLYYLIELTTFMSVLNVCLDPLIYFIFCKALRMQINIRGVSTSSS